MLIIILQTGTRLFCSSSLGFGYIDVFGLWSLIKQFHSLLQELDFGMNILCESKQTADQQSVIVLKCLFHSVPCQFQTPIVWLWLHILVYVNLRLHNRSYRCLDFLNLFCKCNDDTMISCKTVLFINRWASLIAYLPLLCVFCWF